MCIYQNTEELAHTMLHLLEMKTLDLNNYVQEYEVSKTWFNVKFYFWM
jgi:hypothetical protein